MKKTEQLFIRRTAKPKRNIAVNLDKEERFVLRNCIVYLGYLLGQDTIVDKKFLEIISWLLGDKCKKIEKHLFDALTEKEKKEYQNDFQNIDEKHKSIDLIYRILYKSNKERISNFLSFIREMLLQHCKSLAYAGSSDTEKKISNMAQMLNLSDQEIKLCTFLYITTTWDRAAEYFISHLKCHSISGRKYFKKVLGFKTKEINAILSGTLIKSGFCEIKKTGFSSTEAFAEYFLSPSNESSEIKYFSKISGKTIPLDNPSVDTDKTKYILKILSDKRKSASHILLHGASGSGKTNYAYGLVKKLGVPAYEINNDNNNVIRRQVAIKACLNKTNKNQGSIIIVNEAENLLNAPPSWLTRDEKNDKGWLRQFMEETDNRLIWIVKSVDEIDNSVLKRFTFSLHFEKFNQRQRLNFWRSAISRTRVKKYFSEDELKELSGTYPVDAAVINDSIKKATDISSTSKEGFKKAIIMNLDAYMELVKNKGKDKDKNKDENKDKKTNKNNIEENYSIEGLNIEGNITSIMEQLKAYDRFLRQSDKKSIHNFNLLFYGPPGTGKSELARYIAETLEREILCKRASDIISPYVGQTEQNINRAFSEAETEEAILIMDEVDSFLFSRGRAVRSFEINRTNEFLTQMERFRGILICTTNMLEGLDGASIRRFNHKIKFDYLKPEGNVLFYQRLLGPLISNPLNEVMEKELQEIRQLTPGDFRIVRDRFSFYPQSEVNHHTLLEALSKECNIKQFQKNGGKRIGF